MKLRILSEADCRAVLDMAAAIGIQAEAFELLAQGRSVEGLRSFAASEDPPGVAIFNPCFLRGAQGYGIKVISDFYENEKRGSVRMSGVVAAVRWHDRASLCTPRGGISHRPADRGGNRARRALSGAPR